MLPYDMGYFWMHVRIGQLDSCRAMELGRRLCQVVLDTLPVPQRDGGPEYSAEMIGWGFRLVV